MTATFHSCIITNNTEHTILFIFGWSTSLNMLTTVENNTTKHKVTTIQSQWILTICYICFPFIFVSEIKYHLFICFLEVYAAGCPTGRTPHGESSPLSTAGEACAPQPPTSTAKYMKPCFKKRMTSWRLWQRGRVQSALCWNRQIRVWSHLYMESKKWTSKPNWRETHKADEQVVARGESGEVEGNG